MSRPNRQGMKTAAGYAPQDSGTDKGAGQGAPTMPAVPGAPPIPGAAAAPKVPPPPPPAGASPATGRHTPVDPAQPINPGQTEATQMAAITRGPIVEVDVSYEQGVSPSAEPLRVAVEVWTQNNVYAMDARMRCVAVRSQENKQLVEDHPFLGTRLVGGQIKGEGSVEMSYPLPRPGSFAVFEGRRGKKRRFSRTSVVEKVVLRLRVVTVTGADATPTWEHLVTD